jgi:inhibitor of KinA sporulation pathway (predicted exonuclease)
MRRLMVDIETLDSSGTAAVIAIGACVFDFDDISYSFSMQIDPTAALQFGTVSDATMKWWGEQDEAVRERMFSGDTTPMDAAYAFAAFVKQHKVKEVWANSPTFDCVILRHLFKSVGVDVPWHYRDERCVRTLYALWRELQPADTGINAAYSETGAHDAVIDARNQARAVSHVLLRLRGKL